MAEPTQKELLQTLVKDVKHIMVKQDNMRTKQDSMDLVQNNILIELSGTSLEPGRGVVPRLIQAEECIVEIKKKQYKIFTWGIVIVGGLNLLFLGIKSLYTLLIKGG